jgi:phospholipid/cholesterol/gamma-HCH transport system ATP-binding protein
VRGLTLAYGSSVVLRDVDFTVERGEVFVIMGVNGSGKSTILKSLTGLLPPVKGQVYYNGTPFWGGDPALQSRILRRIGILYQRNAL